MEDASTQDAELDDARETDVPFGDAIGVDDANPDASVDRLTAPDGVDPPDTDLEPGSDADDVYRYCWHLARILCIGHYSCCEVEPVQRLGNDQEECNELLAQGFCEQYRLRPDAIGPQDRDELERDLDQLLASSADCSEPISKIGIALGNLELGGDCSGGGLGGHLLCAQRASCVGGVCTPPPEVGEACGPGIYDCDIDAYCDSDDTCAALLPLDTACDADGQCETRSCESNVCAPDPFDTWCLDRDRLPD